MTATTLRRPPHGHETIASLDVVDRVYLTGELDAVTTFFRAEQRTGASLHAAFAVRGDMLVGVRW